MDIYNNIIYVYRGTPTNNLQDYDIPWKPMWEQENLQPINKSYYCKKMCVFVYHEMFKLSLNLMQKTALPI